VYYKKALNEDHHKDIRKFRNSLVHFKKFVGKNYLQPSEVTRELLENFKVYLQKQNLANETVYSYMMKLKIVCKKAYHEVTLSLLLP